MCTSRVGKLETPSPPTTEILKYTFQCIFIYNNHIIMPARLLDDIIHRIQIHLESEESLVEIYKATKVSKNN